jgi:hypothetical protein
MIKPIIRILNHWIAKWKYRHVDPNLCCCGDMMGKGGSICHHGGCRSMKEYCITTETGFDKPDIFDKM